MLSKGVDLYSFSSGGFSIQSNHIVYEHCWRHPVDGCPKDNKQMYLQNYQYGKHSFQMEAAPSTSNDCLSIAVFQGDNQIYERSIQVSGITGNIDSEDLNNMMAPSHISADSCFSFGLYYSDSGHGGLTNAHQLYGIVTENQSQWMERLFNDIGEERYANILLSDLIFPGSHDAGMYIEQPNHYLAAFANTQKDPIQYQLALGARVFDFRPGTLTPGWGLKLWDDVLPEYLKLLFGAAGIVGAEGLEALYADKENEIRHIHSFIPGATYEQFLLEIIPFLMENKNEIVIINAVSNGISEAVNLAHKSDLDNLADKVLKRYSSRLKMGDKQSLKKGVKELIDTNERLIVIGNDDVMGIGNGVKSESSYSDGAYQSANSENIVGAINELNGKEWSGKDIVEFFLQMTATATEGGIARIVSSNYQSASPLFATKAATDMLTYEWFLNGNLKSDNQSSLVTIYNDFYDPGLTAIIAKVLRERLG